MIRKSLLLLFAFVLTEIMIVACVCDEDPIYHKVEDVSVTNCNQGVEIDDSAVVASTNYRIRMHLETVRFTQQMHRATLINSAYALKCEGIHKGLTPKVTSFKLFCNKEILGMPPGKQIDNEFLRAYMKNEEKDPANERFTIAEWRSKINDLYATGGTWYFEFRDKIISDEYLQFTVYLKLEDGTEYNLKTNAVRVL